jgi:Protein of unknown function, DUF547
MLHTLFKTLLCLALLVNGSSSFAQGRPAFDHEHGQWTKLLEATTRGAAVNYKQLERRSGELDAYLKVLQAVEPKAFGQWSREQRYAFWINAYNAYTLRLVVDHYPLKSIRDIGSEEIGTWDRRFIALKPLFPTAEGKLLSLNDIEHEILRKQFKDARVHAAVNCASKGCPPLRKAAFTAKKLEEQLDTAVREWLADEEQARFDERERSAEVSEIFRWFESDFVRDGGSVAGWLAKYAPESQRKWLAAGELTLSYKSYDWALNDVPQNEAERRPAGNK